MTSNTFPFKPLLMSSGLVTVGSLLKFMVPEKPAVPGDQTAVFPLKPSKLLNGIPVPDMVTQVGSVWSPMSCPTLLISSILKQYPAKLVKKVKPETSSAEQNELDGSKVGKRDGIREGESVV